MLDLWNTLQQWFTQDLHDIPDEPWPPADIPGISPDDLTRLWHRSDILDPSALAHILWFGLRAGQAGWTVARCDDWHATVLPQAQSPAGERRIALFHEIWRSGLQQFDGQPGNSHYHQGIMDLLSAMAQQHVQAYYQPVIETTTGRVHSAEALVRWNDHGRIRTPGEFLPMAQSAGLLALVDMLVWSQVLRDLPDFLAVLPTLSISINAGQTPIEQAAWPAFLAEWRQHHGLAPYSVSIEVLESLLATTSLRQTLNVLAEHGFNIALDDFGTRTAMDLLGEASIHTMKIDRSLIVAGSRNPRLSIIVQGLVTMAHDLGLDTVAEGVETADQWQACMRWGIDGIQGFLFAHPMPRADFIRFLQNSPCALPLQAASG
jgi:EAL domain-containing protein (putative c-di-GMP-specific phosphodiesterase class I)